MMIKSSRDFWSGLMLISVGTAFAIGALRYTFGTSARPGPGFLPIALGALLALLGLLLTLKSLATAATDREAVGRIVWRPPLLVLGALLLFAFLLPRAGMFVSLPILVVISARAGDEFRLVDALAGAVVLTIGSWLVFIKGLGLTIPLLPAFLAG